MNFLQTTCLGMISNIVNGEADMITTSVTICCGRTNAIDPLWPLSETTTGLAIKGKMRKTKTQKSRKAAPF